jgi:large subunit ribosomal protein L16
MRPNNLKYPKAHKGGRLNPGIKLDNLYLGDIGLIANEPAILKSSHLLSAELAIKRVLKKEGVIFFRVFTHTPVTKKPLEVRMGKGKGSVDHYVAKVQKGSMILEIKSSLISKAYTALLVAKSKLPLFSTIVFKKVI